MIKGGNPVPKIDFELEEIVARIKKGTRIRMIALVVFFVLICFARWGWGIPLPNRILILTIFWLAVSSTYNFLVGREARIKMVRIIYSRYFLLEMLILTFLLYFLGLGGWMGAIFYIFPIIYANSILGRKEGRFIILVAILYYLLPVLLDYYQVLSHRRILATFDLGPYRNTPFVPVSSLVVIWVFVFVGYTSSVFSSMLRQRSRELLERTRELKRTQEELLRKGRLAAMGEMAAGLVHEIRNPLTVMKNSLYLLGEVVSHKEKAKRHLDLIDLQLEEASYIVKELLDFTREIKPQLFSTSVNDAVRMSLSSRQIPRPVKVVDDLSQDLPQIKVDETQIKQILINLISNAIQAMPEGGKLSVRTYLEHSYLTISISDTGEGISKENLDKIFQPLFTTKQKGIGLGLTVTKRLVEANAGRIEVNSKKGEGSTFFLRFPVVSKDR
ncbi:Adaptive-response sensory-kinase SasA [subsurface metagenome]